MHWGGLVDPIASRLLDLQAVSGTQWVLRLSGIAAMVLAVLTTLPGGLFSNIGAGIVSLAVALTLIVQFLRPDSDIGLLGPAAIIIALAGQGDLTMLRAAGVGFALLLSHAAFALAATIPAHGVFERSAWRLGGRGLLVVLAVSIVGSLVVASLSGIQFGSWMLVLGVLGVIALFVTVLPRTR